MTNGSEPGRDGRSGGHGHGARDALGQGRGGRTLHRLTRALALIGGALLLASVTITVVSVTGRHGFSRPVPGDYELVEIVCAVAVFLFFPFTHAANANITAEFFTAALSPRRQRLLDLIHDLVFALIAALLCWRLGHGLADKFATGDMTMLIHIPLWWAYGFAVLSMALLTLVCVGRVAEHLKALRR